MRISSFPIINDLRESYKKLRQDGYSREEAVDGLVDEYANELSIGAEDDGLLFWIGLADGQFDLKELSQEVADKGLIALGQLEKMIPEITPGDLQKRRERYACAPMAERKNIKKPTRFRCQWKIGDTFAYRLSGPEAEKHGIAGEYVLLRKVDELESDGRVTPVVTLTHWKSSVFPASEEELQRIPLLKVANGRFNSPSDTFEYRVEILFTRKKQITELALEYVGCFPDIIMPEDEFYYRRPGCVMMMFPKSFDWDLSYFCFQLQEYYKKLKDPNA